MRTENAASNVSAAAISGSMVMFACFYVILISSFFIFARKWLRAGPDLTIVPPAEPVRAGHEHATVSH
jgi:cytochrome d ubiquinol oxidase subunit I